MSLALRAITNVIKPLRRCTFSTLSIESNTDNFLLEAKEINVLPEHLQAALQTSPKLAHYAPSQWIICHKSLISQGFKSQDFLPMITANPALLKKRPQDIEIQLEHWRNCQFGEKHLFTMLVQCPILIEAKGEALCKIIPSLQEFAGTRKNVGKLLLSCPNLAFEKWSIIQAKINYLTQQMKVDASEIMKSTVFKKSLNEIQCRHVFLDRLGLYEVRHPKIDPNEPSKNPKLSKIMDTADKHFAIKVAGVTYEEFLVFQELHAQELETNWERYTDDDSDGEK